MGAAAGEAQLRFFPLKYFPYHVVQCLFLSILVSCESRFLSKEQACQSLWFNSLRSGAKTRRGSKSRPGLFYQSWWLPPSPPRNPEIIHHKHCPRSSVSIQRARQRAGQANSILFFEVPQKDAIMWLERAHLSSQHILSTQSLSSQGLAITF